MISKTIESNLNEQLSKEAYSSDLYLAMASWCEKSAYMGSAKFFYKQSGEERDHMLKFFHYINESDGHALVARSYNIPTDFKALFDIFQAAYEHEKMITKSIAKLVENSLGEKDFTTFNFLQWFVSEQHEEEQSIKQIIDMFKLAGTEGRGLYLVDKAIGKLAEPKS